MAPPTGERDKPGKLYLGGLSFNTDEDKLREHFLKYGKLEDVQVIKDKVSGVSRGFGFVTYINPADAEDAVAGMDGMEVDGKYIKVAHAMKSKTAVAASGRSDDRGRETSSRGGSSRGGSRGSFNKPPPWSGGSWYESQTVRTSSPTASRGRGRGPPLMDSGRGRGGSYRGRGGPPRSLLGRGDDDYGSSRGPLLSTPLESDYGREEDGLYAPRLKAAPPPRSSRPSPYAREDDLEGRRRPAPMAYERKSRLGPPPVEYGIEAEREPLYERAAPARYDDLDIPERSSRSAPAYGRQPAAYDSLISERDYRASPSADLGYDPLPPAREARLPASSYGREPDGYGSLPSERASRAPLASYDREPATYGREAAVYGRDEPAYDRQSSYPPERESSAASRHAVLDDPYAGRSREPALSDYPASRPVARDYPVVERSSRAELARDPYARDPYAPVAREPAVARDYERGRELPSAAPLEREVYPQSRAYSAPSREPAARAVGDYDRPLAREYPAERNGSYVRERESLDPYGAASAGSSRYESYPPTRDAYAPAPRTEKSAYGARDPYGAAPAARSGYR